MKFLICGMGSIGLRHLANLKNLGYKDIIIYSTGKNVMPGVKEATLGLKVFNDINEAFEQNPDICMITNPSSLHVEIALIAAENRCHLYIEKPLSHNLKDLDKLEKIIKNNELITFITYQFRFNPHINKLKFIFQKEEEKYGKPLYVTTEWSEYLPDWHPWEDYKKSYSARKDLGGGVLLTQIHPLNYLNYIFGEIDNVQINKISSKALDIEVDDIADILINFSNGMSGHVHIDFLQKPRVHTMKIVTNKGQFEWNYHENILLFIHRDMKKERFENHGFERNDMFILMLKDFIKSVENKSRTRFNLDDAIVELRLILNNNNLKDNNL